MSVFVGDLSITASNVDQWRLLQSVTGCLRIGVDGLCLPRFLRSGSLAIAAVGVQLPALQTVGIKPPITVVADTDIELLQQMCMVGELAAKRLLQLGVRPRSSNDEFLNVTQEDFDEE